MESLDDEEDGGGTSVGVAGGGGWASQEKLTHPPPEPPRIQTATMGGEETTNNPEEAGSESSGNVIKRRRACGDCPPCRVTENCEDCAACRTRATSKQKCERRKCLNMIFNKPDEQPQPPQHYEVKQLLFSEWTQQKTSQTPSEASVGSTQPPNEVLKEVKPLMKTCWRCKVCDLAFPPKDKSVVLSHIATCHRDLDFTQLE